MKLIPLKENPDEIIGQLVKKLREKYGSRLILVGAMGSIATNKFTPLSDLDLIVVLNEETRGWAEFMYGTTYIDIRILGIEKLSHKIESLNMFWPVDAGSILSMKICYEVGDSFLRLKNTFEELKKDKEQFEHAVELNTFTAFSSKAYRAFEEKDFVQLRWAAVKLTGHFASIIALLNQTYYSSAGPIDLINQIKVFSFRPEGWETAFRLSLDTRPENTLAGIEQMWRILCDLKKDYAFRNFDVKNIEDITF